MPQPRRSRVPVATLVLALASLAAAPWVRTDRAYAQSGAPGQPAVVQPPGGGAGTGDGRPDTGWERLPDIGEPDDLGEMDDVGDLDETERLADDLEDPDADPLDLGDGGGGTDLSGDLEDGGPDDAADPDEFLTEHEIEVVTDDAQDAELSGEGIDGFDDLADDGFDDLAGDGFEDLDEGGFGDLDDEGFGHLEDELTGADLGDADLGDADFGGDFGF